MRKNWHKVLSLGLAMVMAFSMAVPAYAAEPPADPLPIQEEIQQEEPEKQDTGEVPGGMETVTEESAPVIPAPTVPEKAPEGEVPKEEAPASDDTEDITIPDDAVPGGAEPSNGDAENLPANNGPFKVKFLEGSDQYGVIFVDGEEVNIKDFVMELYPTDGVSFCVEPSDGQHVPSAVDFTGDCKLEAVEGGFILSEVKSDVDLLVTYEEGVANYMSGQLADLNSEAPALEQTEITLTEDMLVNGLKIKFSETGIKPNGILSGSLIYGSKTTDVSIDDIKIETSDDGTYLVISPNAIKVQSDTGLYGKAPNYDFKYTLILDDKYGTEISFSLICGSNNLYWDIGDSESSVFLHLNTDDNSIHVFGSGCIRDFNYYSSSFDSRHPYDLTFTSNTYWGYHYGNTIKTLVIDDSITGIGAYTFLQMPALTSITGGQNVAYIGGGAFARCDSLTEISFPNVETIYHYAFAASGLCKADLPKLSCLSGYCIFAKCGFSGVLTTDNFTTSRTVDAADTTGLFYSNRALTGINIDCFNSLGSGAFNGCSAIGFVNMPNLEECGPTLCGGYYLSQNCITYIDLPDLKTISGTSGSLIYAFSDSSNKNGVLQYINLPSMKSVDLSRIYDNYAEYCPSFTDFYLDSCESLAITPTSSSSYRFSKSTCNVTFHIPNNPVLQDKFDACNLRWTSSNEFESTDESIPVKLCLQDARTGEITNLKDDAVLKLTSDGSVYKYTDWYRIPNLDDLLSFGKEYAGLRGISGPWVGGMNKNANDYVRFPSDLDEITLTYMVFGYGSTGSLSDFNTSASNGSGSIRAISDYSTSYGSYYPSKKYRVFSESGKLLAEGSHTTYLARSSFDTDKIWARVNEIDKSESSIFLKDAYSAFNITNLDLYEWDVTRGIFSKDLESLTISSLSTIDLYLKTKSIKSDSDCTISFMDEKDTVYSWDGCLGSTMAIPAYEKTRPGYKFIGWALDGDSSNCIYHENDLFVGNVASMVFRAVWDYDYDYVWNTPFIGSVTYYDPYGNILSKESKELSWGRDYDLTEFYLGPSFEKDGVRYIQDSATDLWSGVCTRNINVRVYTKFDPNMTFDSINITYRIYDTYHKSYITIGSCILEQNSEKPGISEELVIPSFEEFEGIEEDHTYVNMYRITGSFINSGATVTEGSTVQFDMTLDNPVITYWVSIYDVNGVPRDVKSESDDSITYTDRWTSLTYAGLSTYRNFTGHIRYHANYPSGYDPVHTVNVPCSVDTKSNSAGDNTPADCTYDASGNGQIETTMSGVYFEAPAGYKAVYSPVRWTAFHGTNGSTSRTFPCYWYKDTMGGSAIGPNPCPTYLNQTVDVYAKWAPIEENGYSIVFMSDGKKVNQFSNLQVDDIIYAPKTALKDGYQFIGWSATKDGTVDFAPGARIASEHAATYYAVFEKLGFELSVQYNTTTGITITKRVIGQTFEINDAYDVKSNIVSKIDDADGHHYLTKMPAKTSGKILGNTIINVVCYLDDNQNGIPDEDEITVNILIVDKNGNRVGELTVTGERDKPIDLTDTINNPYTDEDGKEWLIKVPEGEYILTENPDPLVAERILKDFVIDLVTEDGNKVGEIIITGIPGDPYDLTDDIKNGYADDAGKEYDIVPPAGGNTVILDNLASLIVNPIGGENPNPGEKDPVPPTALDTIVYEFYKDKPSEIAVPIQMNDAKNLIRLRLGNDKMPEDAYGMVDDAIILSPEYLMNVEEGAYRLLPTFDDPAGTTIPNLVVKVYESVADRMDPCLFYKRILFDGTNSTLKYYEGKGDAYANDVLALVIDDQMVTPEGMVMDFTDENVSTLVSKTPMMFRTAYSLLASDAFSAENGQIMLDGPFVSSMNLAAGDHLVGAVFDNTSRTVDVNKVVLTIPKKTITITLEFKAPDGTIIAVKEVSGTQGEAYDLKKHIPATITGSDGKAYVPGELADAKGTFSEDGVVEVPCKLKEETDPGTDPVKPSGDATLTVKFVNPDGRTVRTFTIAGKDGDAYDVSEQIPALFVGTDGKAYKAEVPEDATGFLKGNKTLIVNCVRKTGSVTPTVPDDGDKMPDKDTDKTPSGTVKPIITTGSSNETTTNRITNNTKTVYLGGSKTGGSVTYHTTTGGSGSKDTDAVKETGENTVSVPEKTETSNTAAAENEKGDAAMEAPIYTGQACGCECMTLVIVLLVIMMFTILLFAAWFIITERRRRDDEKREQARLDTEKQAGIAKE